jgi:hypothetical protein
VVVTVTLAAFVGWQVWSGLSAGRVMGRSGSPISRAARPAYFWMTFGLYVAIFAVLGSAGALELMKLVGISN